MSKKIARGWVDIRLGERFKFEMGTWMTWGNTMILRITLKFNYNTWNYERPWN